MVAGKNSTSITLFCQFALLNPKLNLSWEDAALFLSQSLIICCCLSTVFTVHLVVCGVDSSNHILHIPMDLLLLNSLWLLAQAPYYSMQMNSMVISATEHKTERPSCTAQKSMTNTCKVSNKRIGLKQPETLCPILSGKIKYIEYIPPHQMFREKT